MNIGILGGTFDPIHRGHSYVAQCVLEMFGLNHILFMVSKFPPHKREYSITSSSHRYAMVDLDLLDNQNLYPSAWEIDQETLSYTVETLQYFTHRYPENQYCFIAGSDSLNEIHLWKDYDKLLEEYCFVFVQRPGIEVDLNKLKISESSKRNIRKFSKKEQLSISPGQSFLASINAPDVSSTSIREMISEGKRLPSEMVSAAVFQYIKKYRLYEKS